VALFPNVATVTVSQPDRCNLLWRGSVCNGSAPNLERGGLGNVSHGTALCRSVSYCWHRVDLCRGTDALASAHSPNYTYGPEVSSLPAMA
jgi:hypothetical protein